MVPELEEGRVNTNQLVDIGFKPADLPVIPDVYYAYGIDLFFGFKLNPGVSTTRA